MASCGEVASFALHSICSCLDWLSKQINCSSFPRLMTLLLHFRLQIFSVSLFWTGAVLCNTVHVIVSGMVFLVLLHGGREAASIPANSLTKSLQYALTTSFGSICYGSLFTAAIRTLRWEVRNRSFFFGEKLKLISFSFFFYQHIDFFYQIRGVRSKIGNNECLLCCVDFLFHLVETLVRFFNKYAYVQVHVYVHVVNQVIDFPRQ